MKQELVTLTPLNGKKAFLFVTGGFEYQPGYVMAQYATGGIGLPTLAILTTSTSASTRDPDDPDAPTATRSPSTRWMPPG